VFDCSKKFGRAPLPDREKATTAMAQNSRFSKPVDASFDAAPREDFHDSRDRVYGFYNYCVLLSV